MKAKLMAEEYEKGSGNCKNEAKLKEQNILKYEE